MTQRIRYRNAIKSLRKLKRLRQRDLASRVGTDRGNIARYESGLRVPELYMALKISVALGTPVERVFFDLLDIAADEVGERVSAGAPQPA